MTLAAGMLLMWCGFTVWRMLPCQRLREKAELFEAAMLALESDHAGNEDRPKKTASKTKSLVHQTIHALECA